MYVNYSGCLLWKSVWRFFKKLKIVPPDDPTMPPLGINLKESKWAHHRDTFTCMFTVALFPTAKTWNPHRCPSTDVWNRKWDYTYRIEFHSTLRRRGIATFSLLCNLEIIFKDVFVFILYVCLSTWIYVCVCHMCAAPTKAKRECQIPQN